MFYHMEFFSLLRSVAAGSRGHLGGWGAPLSCLQCVLGAVDSKTGPSSLCPDFQQTEHPVCLVHWPVCPWLAELTQPWPFSSSSRPGSSWGCQSSLSLSWQQQDKLSPVLLLCTFAVCLQEKDFSLQLLFIKLRKRAMPRTQSPDIYWQHGSDSSLLLASANPVTVSFGNMITIVHVSHSSISSVSWPWKTSCYWILTKLLMESLEADVARFINAY